MNSFDLPLAKQPKLGEDKANQPQIHELDTISTVAEPQEAAIDIVDYLENEFISTSPSDPGSTCVICLDAPGRFKVGVDCLNHRICDECFSEYSENEVLGNHKLAVMCPVPGCAHNYTHTRLSNAMFQKVLENRRTVSRVQQSCPCCGKENSLRLGALDNAIKNRVEVQCVCCSATLCLFCYDPILPRSRFRRALTRIRWRLCTRNHHTCSSVESAALLEHVMDQSQQVKPCPKCFKLIHRTEGCRNMQCSGPLGCGSAFCWDCLTVFGAPGPHQCQVDPLTTRARIASGIIMRPLVYAAALFANFLKSALVVVVSIPAAPILLAHRCYKERKNKEEARNRQLRDAPRVLGINLFNVPNRALLAYLRYMRRQGQTEQQLGRRSQDRRCYRAFQLFGDGHTLVNLHVHDEDEPCELVSPQCSALAMEALFNKKTVHVSTKMPLSHTFCAEDFAELTAFKVQDAEEGLAEVDSVGMLDQDVHSQLHKGIRDAITRFRDEAGIKVDKHSTKTSRKRVAPEGATESTGQAQPALCAAALSRSATEMCV